MAQELGVKTSTPFSTLKLIAIVTIFVKFSDQVHSYPASALNPSQRPSVPSEGCPPGDSQGMRIRLVPPSPSLLLPPPKAGTISKASFPSPFFIQGERSNTLWDAPVGVRRGHHWIPGRREKGFRTSPPGPSSFPPFVSPGTPSPFLSHQFPKNRGCLPSGVRPGWR